MSANKKTCVICGAMPRTRRNRCASCQADYEQALNARRKARRAGVSPLPTLPSKSAIHGPPAGWPCAKCGRGVRWKGYSWCRSCQQSYDRERMRRVRGYKGQRTFLRDAPLGTSWCSDCAAFRPVADFGPDSSRPDGLKAYCRQHQAARSRVYSLAYYHRRREQA